MKLVRNRDQERAEKRAVRDAGEGAQRQHRNRSFSLNPNHATINRNRAHLARTPKSLAYWRKQIRRERHTYATGSPAPEVIPPATPTSCGGTRVCASEETRIPNLSRSTWIYAEGSDTYNRESSEFGSGRRTPVSEQRVALVTGAAQGIG